MKTTKVGRDIPAGIAVEHVLWPGESLTLENDHPTDPIRVRTQHETMPPGAARFPVRSDWPADGAQPGALPKAPPA